MPATPAVGRALDLPATLPLLGTLSAAFLPLVAINEPLDVLTFLGVLVSHHGAGALTQW